MAVTDLYSGAIGPDDKDKGKSFSQKSIPALPKVESRLPDWALIISLHKRINNI